MTQIKTPEEVAAATVLDQWRIPDETDAEQVLEQVLDARDGQTAHDILDSIRAAIETDRAQRDDVIEKVRAYATDRAVHARHPILNQVGSGRIASDLFQILGLPDPFPEDEEVTEPEVVNCIHCGKPVEWVDDGVISDWKHAEPDSYGYTFWYCDGANRPGGYMAEAPEGTPHP